MCVAAEKMPGDKAGCNYLVNALSIVVVGASGDLAKKKVSVLTGILIYLKALVLLYYYCCCTRCCIK